MKANVDSNATPRSISRSNTWKPALVAKTDSTEAKYFTEPVANPEIYEYSLRTDRSKRSSSAMKAWKPALVAPKNESTPLYETEPISTPEVYEQSLRPSKKASE